MERKIREIINRNGEEFYEEYFKSKRDDWNILCASMDTIGDTTTAIEYFIKNGVGEDTGEKYLKLYGLLQAIFLQQDAIKYLSEVIKRSFDNKDEIPSLGKYKQEAWLTLRKYRNLSSGHPIDNTTFQKGVIKRAMISRVTISKVGFELLISDPKEVGLRFEYVNLNQLVEAYLLEAKAILTDLETFLDNYKF